MMQLPAGATGFFEAGTFREPIRRKEFLQLIHRLALEGCGIVGEADTDLCGKNFYAANIVWKWGKETLLMNVYTGHLACSGDWKAQPLQFTDPSATLATLLPADKLLSPALLGQSLDGALDELTPAEQKQLHYWKPGTVGEILFNFWD